MFRFIKKSSFSALMALLTLSTSYLAAGDCCCPNNRLYIGAFGGGLYSNQPRITQTGVAFFTEAEGGPLGVNARGHLRKKSSGFGGVQLGYEWTGCTFLSDFNLSPAVEAEAFWYKHSQKGSLVNDVPVRLEEHDFVDSFKQTTGVYLVNLLLNLNNCWTGNFTPYIGGGIGAAHVSLKNGRSIQINPPETVNHFNSDPNYSNWAFAAQAKLGVRYNFCERFHLFAEYRFLFVDTTNYIFGQTIETGHPVTTSWNVQVRKLYYNAFALGLQYDL